MKKAITSALLCFCVTAANAESGDDRGFYIGGAYGNARFSDDANNTRLDDSSRTLRAFGGFRFNSNLALEGSVDELGSYDETSTLKSGYLSTTIAVKGILPLGSSGFDLYGDLGLGTMIRVQEQSGSDDADSNFTEKLGAGFRFTPKSMPSITYHLGYDHFQFESADSKFGTGAADKNTIKAYRAGAQYNY